MRITIFTAEDHNGGILQFAKEMVSALHNDLHHEVLFYLPNVNAPNNEKSIDDSTIRYYRKRKKIFTRNKHIKQIKSSIENDTPDIVIFPENSPISLQVLINLNKKIKKVLYVHDVTNHPSNLNIKRILNNIYHKILMKMSLNSVDNVVLLSKNSYNKFINLYKKHANLAIESTLCSHAPNVLQKKPIELNELYDYLLFFGRIDKYKGLDILVETYMTAYKVNHNISHLVIAGKGYISGEIKEIIDNCKNITLINRFIQDEEMIALVKNSSYVVLPYIEASQSGVLPIAYSFSKPVIASSIEGLKEYVIPEKTGHVFSNKKELYELLLSAQSLRYDTKSINQYYIENFIMKNIMQKVLIKINVK